MKAVIKRVKPYLRWFILGGTLFFLLKTFKDHWREVAAVRIDGRGWGLLAIALLVTLLAHVWSGWVWTWILKMFKQPIKPSWALQVYLKTNLAKYLPGNVWHFYGRIVAVSQTGGSWGVASISVLLEPLLMAASALLIAMISSSFGLIQTTASNYILILQILALVVVLAGVHPRILNPLIMRLNRFKKDDSNPEPTQLTAYPIVPLLGEMGFLILRGTGFLLALMALMTVPLAQIPYILSIFSFAWLLGLVVPGAPGGMGVFEATAIALINTQQFPVATILTVVAIFRLISIIAEAIAAGLAWLSEYYK